MDALIELLAVTGDAIAAEWDLRSGVGEIDAGGMAVASGRRFNEHPAL